MGFPKRAFCGVFIGENAHEGRAVALHPQGKWSSVRRTEEAEELVFTHTDQELLPVLEELRQREPIFHTLAFAASPADYERATAPDYWEVGASGRRYSREFILQELYTAQPPVADSLGWRCWDHAVRRLGSDTYLITYVLEQGDRLTRRATIWQRVPDGWRILYHQGTIVQAEEDDGAPASCHGVASAG
jgi:hypothetical protein